MRVEVGWLGGRRVFIEVGGCRTQKSLIGGELTDTQAGSGFLQAAYMNCEIPGAGGCASEAIGQDQIDAQARVSVLEFGYQRGDMPPAETERRKDCQVARDFTAAFRQRLGQLRHGLNDLAAMLGKQLAFFSQGQLTAVAVDKMHPQPRLERSQPLRNRRR